MAYFYRLIVGCFLAFSGASSFAVVPLTSQLQYCWNNGTNCVLDQGAAKAAYKADWLIRSGTCAGGSRPAMTVYVQATNVTSFSLNHYTGGCDGSPGPYYNSGGSWLFTWYQKTTSSCPSNSSQVASSCVCNSGFVDDPTHQFCITAAVANKAVVDGLNFVDAPLVGSGGGLNTCYAGVPVVATGSATGGTVTNYFGPFKVGSHDCTSAPVATAPAGAAACKSTEYFGQINGVDTCIPATTTTSSSGSVTATPPGVTASTPSGTASAPVIAGAPSGTVGTSTVTTCEGGNCSTVTSFTGSGGSALGTKTESVPQKTFCAENPTASVCVSGTFSGSCGAPPACSGDAVMCAVAAATFATNCTLSPSPNSESAAYDAAKLVTGEVVSTLPGSVTTAFGPSSFDQTELLGAAQGLSSFDVQVMGQTMSVDMSVLNVWLVRLGYILQALSFMLAVRIVGRGY